MDGNNESKQEEKPTTVIINVNAPVGNLNQLVSFISFHFMLSKPILEKYDLLLENQMVVKTAGKI